MAQDNNRLEIEAKLLVDDLDAVRARLDADAGAQLARPRQYEYNIRYEDAAESLTPAGIVLRLRQDDRVRLTYKARAAQVSAGAHTRFEAEVDVSDFETMDLILKRLGYRESVIYEKYRTTYTLAGAEVVLDEMPFGAFVEVEGAPEAIEEAIAQLGLEDAPRFTVGYMLLFDYVKDNLGLSFRDLSFENFRGIDVPPEAFLPPA